MADKNGKIARKIIKEEIEELQYNTEVLHDQKGAAWIISDQHVTILKEQSKGHKLQVISAKSLIDRNFKGAGLTEQQRKVIMLFTEGLNQSDIAKFLKLHKSTVREHLEAAKEKLKKLIPEFRGEL